MGLLFPIDLALTRSFWLETAREGIVQPLLDKAPTYSLNRWHTHLYCLADLLVGPTRSLLSLIGFEQNACMRQLAGWRLPRYDQPL
jgi:hypothetical protein